MSPDIHPWLLPAPKPVSEPVPLFPAPGQAAPPAPAPASEPDADDRPTLAERFTPKPPGNLSLARVLVGDPPTSVKLHFRDSNYPPDPTATGTRN